MHIGHAVAFMRQGKRVSRAGWNGKGMFLILVPGSPGLTVDEGRPLAKAGIPVGTRFNYLPHVDMFTAQGDFVPWLCSQSDLLADDWGIVDDSTEFSDRASLTTISGTDLVVVERDLIGAAMHCVREIVGTESATYKRLSEIAFSLGTPPRAKQPDPEFGETRPIKEDTGEPLTFDHDSDVSRFLAGGDEDL